MVSDRSNFDNGGSSLPLLTARSFLIGAVFALLGRRCKGARRQTHLAIRHREKFCLLLQKVSPEGSGSKGDEKER